MDPLLNYLINSMILGVILNFPLLFLIIRKKLLTVPYGIISGAIVTLSVYIISPYLWGALLFFFLSSSLVSKWKIVQKEPVLSEFSKNSQRDSLQVFSNSLPALIFGMIYLFLDFFPTIINSNNRTLFIMSPWLFAAFASIATHNADTWMTEIGISINKDPKLITNLRKTVPKGTSGGVSIIGTSAGIIGSMIISSIFIIPVLMIKELPIIELFKLYILLISIGVIGSLIDSLEGATIQGIYYCKLCQKETEKQIHKCGVKTEFLRGYKLVTNDLVNLTSAFLSGCLAVIVYWLFI